MITENKNNNTILRITNLVKCLAAEQQEELEKKLQRLVMSMEGEKLTNSVRPNSITMEEIVAEVRAVRNAKC